VVCVGFGAEATVDRAEGDDTDDPDDYNYCALAILSAGVS
jgi:hypothetical protein